MAKKSRTKSEAAPLPLYDGKVVGPREPCPCGSGKRYKACHGAPGGAAPVFVKRPFEGLPNECDLVALRELVPSATAPVTIKGYEDTTVQLGTLLPMIAPAMRRDSGQVWLGLQVLHHSGDASRDLAAALLTALEADVSGVYGGGGEPGPGPRLQDLIADESLSVTVHEGFDWWLADVDDVEGADAMLEQANEAAVPTERLTQVEAAYWTSVGTKEHLRWVMPEPEEELLSALARLHVSGDDVIVEDARLVGMFRAHGLLAPVWDLPVGTGVEALEDPATEFRARLDATLAELAGGAELTAEERSARAGLANRQVTIRQ
ncbi:DUF5926 family protein [Nocardioides insulae]|uniref:DUF5926 family protein n=1 Tax=Nocardioides insulae TaxID=394734 RepID=UPI0004114A24|nr:DUF5926 family protein [Nocardioides insulae]